MKKRSLKRWKSLVWKLCSEYNRKKMATSDGVVRCVSCGGIMRWDEAQAGHIIDGRGNAILFCDDAIFPQCVACNIFRNGNKVEYTLWFLKKFGQEKLDELRILAKQPVKRKEADYEVLIEEYKQKITKLSAGEKTVPSRTPLGMPALASRDNNYERKQ